jgi:site-specific DNA recombinase
MSKRAIIYVRVSTDEQAEKGYSLPSQLEACRAYAEQQGMIVAVEHEFSDDYTGTKLQRPELDKAREVLQRGEANALIVHSSDRLSRRQGHSILLREELQREGIELHYVRRGKSENTPEGRMMDNIEGAFNEYWSEKIREAAMRGMWRKAKSGKVVGTGWRPYGYRYADGALVIIEAEAKVVRSIYDWYLSGMPGRAIAARLSKMGVPKPRAGEAKVRMKRGARWSLSTVRRILGNETYCGTWRYGKKIGSGGNGGTRPLKETAEVSVPAIVSRAVWQAAQERRDFNKRMASRHNTRHAYLLRGMIECGACKRPDDKRNPAMIGTNTREWRYYRCARRTNDIHAIDGHTCSQRDINAGKLEAHVWDYVVKLMLTADEFKQALLEAQDAEQASIEPKERELADCKRALDRVDREASALATALRRVDGVVGEKLQREMDEVNATYASLKREREKLEAEIASARLTDAEIDALMHFREDLAEGIEYAEWEDKRKALEALRLTVTINGTKARVRCRLPRSEREIEITSACSAARQN